MREARENSVNTANMMYTCTSCNTQPTNKVLNSLAWKQLGLSYQFKPGAQVHFITALNI